jgi:hypothetical protein
MQSIADLYFGGEFSEVVLRHDSVGGQHLVVWNCLMFVGP